MWNYSGLGFSAWCFIIIMLIVNFFRQVCQPLLFRILVTVIKFLKCIEDTLCHSVTPLSKQKLISENRKTTSNYYSTIDLTVGQYGKHSIGKRKSFMYDIFFSLDCDTRPKIGKHLAENSSPGSLTRKVIQAIKWQSKI